MELGYFTPSLAVADLAKTMENSRSAFMRGIRGGYQNTAAKYHCRNLTGFDFRYDHRVALGVNDEARTLDAIGDIVGERLVYRDSSWSSQSS